MKYLPIILILAAALFLFSLSGCATTHKESGHELSRGKQDSLEQAIDTQKKNENLADSNSSPNKHISIDNIAADSEIVIAGLNLLEDSRAKADISYLTSIKEKVSKQVADALRQTQVFDEIHFPALNEDNIVISGKIKEFSWKSYDTIISYIPGLNVLPFLGLPSTGTQSEVQVYLEIKANKSNEVILALDESHKQNRKYNMYSFNPGKANEELAYCFEIVINKIKQKIIVNKNKILEAARPLPSAPIADLPGEHPGEVIKE